MKLRILFLSTLTVTGLHAQQAADDPFRAPPAETNSMDEAAVINISICYETFSLPLAMAAKLQREQPGDSDLYTRLITEVEKEVARQETFTVVRSKSGQKATTEGISETIYATEYEPPELPNSVGVAISGPSDKTTPTSVPDVSNLEEAETANSFTGIQTPATPTSYETRNVGVTVEVEPTLDSSSKIVDLRIAPDIVSFAGQTVWGQGLSRAEMPTFEAQRITTSATLRINQPFLLGTVNRPPVSEIDPDSAERVWFAFVTATLAKP